MGMTRNIGGQHNVGPPDFSLGMKTKTSLHDGKRTYGRSASSILIFAENVLWRATKITGVTTLC